MSRTTYLWRAQCLYLGQKMTFPFWFRMKCKVNFSWNLLFIARIQCYVMHPWQRVWAGKTTNVQGTQWEGRDLLRMWLEGPLSTSVTTPECWERMVTCYKELSCPIGLGSRPKSNPPSNWHLQHFEYLGKVNYISIYIFPLNKYLQAWIVHTATCIQVHLTQIICNMFCYSSTKIGGVFFLFFCSFLITVCKWSSGTC